MSKTLFINKKEPTKILLGVTLLIIAFFLLPQVSNAEVKRDIFRVELLGDFVLEPAKNEVFLNPGDISTKAISITNRKDANVSFQIEIEDIVGSNDPNQQVQLLGDEKGPYSLKDFLIPEITEFTLAPGEKITIPIEVSLPEDSEPRGYYGALVVSSKGEESQTGETGEVEGVTKIVTRLGSIFLVRINGEVSESSSLYDFKTIGPSKKFYAQHPRGFELAVENTGNVHLVHYGEIKIKNIFGKEISNLPVNAFFSLPDSTRYREILWPESFAFGFYKAELNLYPGFETEDEIFTSTTTFFVLPWRIVVLVLAIAVLIFALIKFLKKNFKLERIT